MTGILQNFCTCSSGKWCLSSCNVGTSPSAKVSACRFYVCSWTWLGWWAYVRCNELLPVQSLLGSSDCSIPISSWQSLLPSCAFQVLSSRQKMKPWLHLFHAQGTKENSHTEPQGSNWLPVWIPVSPAWFPLLFPLRQEQQPSSK